MIDVCTCTPVTEVVRRAQTSRDDEPKQLKRVIIDLDDSNFASESFSAVFLNEYLLKSVISRSIYLKLRYNLIHLINVFWLPVYGYIIIPK